MTVDERAVFKELNSYLHRHPDETGALMPLFDSMLDHAHQGTCLHRGRCPVIRSGAVLVNEHGRALTLRHGAGWGFAEGAPESADLTLRQTAARVLADCAGVLDLWPVPIAEGPVVIDVSRTVHMDVPRTRYGFRYLFRVRSGVLLRTLTQLGQARWISLDAVGPPLLSARLKERLAVSS
ncbi:NUDIX hydrolase [Streptomyces sp. NPDC059863]|uniref:NUDIX hydrolase n=1 Tax=unclassified Streptomyces TaxID=2593676 RepID=UPI00365DAB6C